METLTLSRSTTERKKEQRPREDQIDYVGRLAVEYFCDKDIWGWNIAFLPHLFENEILCGLYARNLAVADACLHLRIYLGYSYRVIYLGLLRQVKEQNIYINSAILDLTSLQTFKESLELVRMPEF